MSSPFVECNFNIAIENDLLSDEIEKLEDTIALIMECLGLHGEVESSVTGNITTFPNDNLYEDKITLLRLVRNLAWRGEFRHERR